MGRKRDKAVSITRYLTGATGIPLLRWNGSHIDSPRPYTIKVTTDGKWWSFSSYMKEISDINGISFVVRYDAHIPSVDKAVVGCTLETFTELLRVYNEYIDRPNKGDD